MNRIYSKAVFQWDAVQGVYRFDEAASAWMELDEHAPIALCCGDPAQQQIGNEQQSAYQTMTQQAQQVFGDSSAVFSDLQSTFAPTVAAGPNQEGFSAGELSSLNSEAVTDTGQAYRNAKSAVGESESAQGGGNSGTTGGATVGTDLGLAVAGANQTANELTGIKQQDYATGRQNYDFAAQALAGAPSVFGAADSANNAATNAGNAAASTANTIAQQSTSLGDAAIGAAGSIIGAGVTGGFSLAAQKAKGAAGSGSSF